MYIVSTQLKHFKSYQDCEIEIQKGLNVICGRNGSGKSNFFWALRFVLGESYMHLSKQERQSLIKDGETFAFVQVKFDNADRRFPTDSDEMVLRRTISLKRDEFTVDGKNLTKTEISNLLEAAGFSSSNSYYIVPQGKVTSLCHAKDNERLRILKEVAGTQTYEDKKSESEKIFEETNLKKLKIDEMLETLDGRIQELEEEKAELMKVVKQEEEKKALLYNLYEFELEEIEVLLNEWNDKKLLTHNTAESDFKGTKEIEDALEKLHTLLRKKKLEISLLTNEIEEITETLDNLNTEKTKLSCWLTDVSDEPLDMIVSKYQSLNKEIDIIKNKISVENLNYIKSKETVDQLITEINNVQAKRNALLCRTGISRFENESERLAFIESEKTRLSDSIKSTQDHVEFLNTILKEKSKEIDTLSEKMIIPVETLDEEYQKCLEEKRMKWRKQKEFRLKLDSWNDQKRDLKNDLRKTCDYNLIMCIENCESIVKELKLEGYYGPLFQLIDAPEELNTVIDVVANNTLLHIVVDTEKTAEIIMSEFKRRNLGRCTFMPLNRVRSKIYSYPDSDEEAVSLKSLLTYDNKFEPVINQVFGKQLVCKEIDSAKKLSRMTDCDCLTLDGTKIERRGPITGGFYGTKSKFHFLKESKKIDSNRNELEILLSNLDEDLRQLEQQSQIYYVDIKNQKLQNQKLETSRDLSANKINILRKQEKNIQEKIAEQILRLQKEKSALDSIVELSKPADHSQDKKELEQANAFLLKKETEFKSKKAIFENLERKMAHFLSEQNRISVLLEEQSNKINAANGRSKLDIKNTLSQVADQIELYNEKQSKLRSELKKMNVEIEDNLKKIDTYERHLQSVSAESTNTKQELDAIYEKISFFLEKKNRITNSIKELGVLPSKSMIKKFKYDDKTKIAKKLNQIEKTSLKNIHVNRRATEQYEEFQEQRVSLVDRREDLENSSSSITDLILEMDKKKESAINLTFKQVTDAFSDIFAKLVPNGKGKLEMTGDSNIKGVAIYAAFPNNRSGFQNMKSLSGGQKTVVALSFIFAIQSVDKQPFYVFDEIDASLDAEYRKSISGILH
eukprot:NODE_305_length_10201_cov_0.856464.p1 type:complete len:1078 gc:universal NODE_305_length_10201_cov_0.856464:1467-4700(+)